MREYIINNFSSGPISDLSESINESISSLDEEPLFGLGVLFEVLWKSSNDKEKKELLDKIYNNIKVK